MELGLELELDNEFYPCPLPLNLKKRTSVKKRIGQFSVLIYALTHYQITNFRLFQTKSADDNFKFDENGRKLSKWIEKTVGKGGIAR